MAKVKDLLVNGSSRFIGKIYASDQFISQVANGTAPFVVSSSTVVANLNADMTDGLHVHTGRNNEVNKIVRTDANGYIQTGYINTNVGTENLAISRIFYEYNNDGYIRKMSPSSFFSVLENSGNNISITVAGQNRKLTVGYASNSDKLDNIDSTGFLQNYSQNYGSSISNAVDISPTLTAGLARVHISNVEFSSVLTGYDFNNKAWQLRFRPSDNDGIYFRSQGVGTAWKKLAFTTDIPTVTNYYWANIKVSASSSTSTQPTFNTCYTSNWFRSTGATGWYSESYGGGWYMTDSSWVRTYNGKGVVAGGFYHSSYASSDYVLTSEGGAISKYNFPYYPWKEQWIDMTGYSESYWHPVVTSLPYSGYKRIKVTVQLNSGTKPSWSTHSSGFTCNLDLLTTAYGWGTTRGETICLNSTYYFADQNPVGWSQLGNSSHGILLLRGGGKYLVCTDWDSSWTIYNQSVTDYGGTQHEQTCGPYTSWPGIFNGATTKNTIYAHLDGNATTATYAASAGNADTVDNKHASDFATAGHTHSLGNKPASDLSSTYPRGISVGGIYNNGYPFQFGSTITASGNGGYFQIAGEWNSSVTGASNYDFPTEMYIRGRRDSYDVWTTWTRVLTDRNYTSYTDGKYLRKDTNDSTSYQYEFTKTNDHAIKVGTIRGRAVGSQTGEYIHLYERVAIGSPSGWGSRNAPTYGLATYGGAWLATDTGNVTIGGTNQLASAWGNFNLTVGKDTNKVVIGYLNSSTNGVVVGGHNNALSAWAPLNIAGTTLYFRINETIKATIDSNGNFGIGTTSPGYKLTVSGSLYSDGGQTFKGMTSIANKGNSASYTEAAVQIREYNFGGAQSDTWGNAPRLAWHWSGRVQAQIGLGGNNHLYISEDGSFSTPRLILHSGNSYVTGGKGVIAGTTITQVSNADYAGYSGYTLSLNSVSLPSSASNSYNTVWCKFATITFNASAWCNAAGYIFFSGGESTDYKGILEYHFRSGQTASELSIAQLYWIVKSHSYASVIAVKTANNIYDFYINNCSSWSTPRIYHFSAYNDRFKWNVGSWSTTKPTAAYTASDIGRVYYATNAGDADTVDSKHASDFAPAGHTHDGRYQVISSTTASGITSLATGSYSSIHISTGSGGTMSFSSTPASGKECHIVIYNSGSSNITITLPSSYRRNVSSITIAASAFGEVNVLNAAGTIYVRAV